VAPPDPITFQQQKKELTPKEKEAKSVIDKLLNAPSLFGEKIDIEAEVRRSLISSKTLRVMKKRYRQPSSKANAIYNTAITAQETSARKPKDIVSAIANTFELLSTRTQTKVLETVHI
jgi:hypothetical protein